MHKIYFHELTDEEFQYHKSNRTDWNTFLPPNWCELGDSALDGLSCCLGLLMLRLNNKGINYCRGCEFCTHKKVN